MINQSSFEIQLCSRCLTHEVNSWVNEKWKELDEDTKKEIHEELKTIKLKSGECIVCNNALISNGTSNKIVGVLNKNKVQEKVQEEFREFF